MMDIDNKTILIIGLILGGMLSLYLKQENIASAIFGGLVGYLSKDIPQEIYNNWRNKPVASNDEGVLNEEYVTGDDDGS